MSGSVNEAVLLGMPYCIDLRIKYLNQCLAAAH